MSTSHSYHKNTDFQVIIPVSGNMDHILDQVDAGIRLDEEQRKVVLSDEDHTLVVAGAGPTEIKCPDVMREYFSLV